MIIMSSCEVIHEIVVDVYFCFIYYQIKARLVYD